MRLNKVVLVFSLSVAILSGCSSTDEKEGSLLEGGDGVAQIQLD
jgi:uncharacterized lipoprotein